MKFSCVIAIAIAIAGSTLAQIPPQDPGCTIHDGFQCDTSYIFQGKLPYACNYIPQKNCVCGSTFTGSCNVSAWMASDATCMAGGTLPEICNVNSCICGGKRTMQ